MKFTEHLNNNTILENIQLASSHVLNIYSSNHTLMKILIGVAAWILAISYYPWDNVLPIYANY